MARGLIQIATDLQTRAPAIAPVSGAGGGNASVRVPDLPAAGSDGSASALRSLAADFSSIGDQVGRYADHAASVEGTREGRLAGMDPEFRPRRDMTIRSEAFDRAGLEVAGARLKQKIDEGLDTLFDKTSGNPDALAKGADGVARGIMANAPEELRPQLEHYIGSKRLAYMREATRQHVAEVRANQAAALQDELQNGLRSLHQKARLMGLDPAADALMAQDVAGLEGVLSRRGLDGKPLVDPVTKGRLRREAEHVVVEARLMGAFDRIDGVAARQAFIDKFEDDWKNGRGIAGKLDFNQARGMRSMLDGELRHDEARRATATAALRADVADVLDKAGKGYAARPEDMARLKSQVATSGSPELSQALHVAESTLQWVQGARRATPAELQQHLDDERARVAAKGYVVSGGDIAHIDMTEKLLGHMRSEIAKDPLGWAEQTGVVDVPPLDFSSPAALATSLKARVPAAETVAARYSLREDGRKAPYLRPDESKALAAEIAKGGENALAVASMIAQAAGDKAPAIMSSLGEHAPAMAFLGNAAIDPRGGVPAITDAANGMALKRTPGFKPMVDSAAGSKVVRDVLGQAIGSSPQTEGAIKQLADAAYEVKAAREAHPSFDADAYRQIVRDLAGERKIAGHVYGGIGQDNSGRFWGGAGVVVPPNIRQDGFGDLQASLKVEDFAGAPPLDAKGRPLPMGVVRNARLLTVGQGRYKIAVGQDADGTVPVAQAKGGGDFVLDFAGLAPALRKRRPDLYLDGER